MKDGKIKMFLKEYRILIILSVIGLFFASFIFADSDELKRFEIKISKENWAKLNSDLPKSGDEYVRGEIILPDGKKVDADFRYRGGGWWHWKYAKKSWRVKLKDNSSYQGQGFLNFINPKDKSNIIDAVDYYFAEKIGLLTPKHEFIKLLINGEYYGVYSMVEQINEDFLKNHGRKINDVYFNEFEETKADIDMVEFLRINNIKQTADFGGFAHPLLWQKRVSAPGKDESDYTYLDGLIKVIQKRNMLDFNKEIVNIVDVDKFLRYIALLNLVGSCHINNVQNLKVYFDPNKEKFEPIVWDVAGMGLTDVVLLPFGKTDNYFFDYLLKVPEYNYLKNRYVWEFMKGEMKLENINQVIDMKAALIRSYLEGDSFKDYVDWYQKGWPSVPFSMEEWEKSLEYTKNWMKKRYEYIDGLLKKGEVKIYYKVDGELLKMIVEVSGYSSVKMEILRKDFEVNRDLNFDNEFDELDTALKENQILLHPGIRFFVDAIEFNFFRTGSAAASLRYGFFIKLTPGMSAEQILEGKVFVLKNAFTDELIKPEINKVDDFKSLPEIKSDSLHPWSQIK